MKPLRDCEVDRAIHVIDTSKAANLLEKAIRPAPQGRKRRLSLRTWLIGAYLGIERCASFKSTTIHEILTTISLDKQRDLGVRWTDPDGNTKVITKAHVDYIARHLPKRLAYTEASVARWKLGQIDQAELDRRRNLVQTAVAAILDASIVLDDGSWYALDGTNTWSWGRSKWVVKDEHDVREREEVVDDPDLLDEDRVRDEIADGLDVDEDDDNGQTDVPTAITGRKVVCNHDPDAAFGSKTSKYAGRESFYGYVLDAAVAIAGPGQRPRPLVLQRVVVSPANTDVVGPTLQILDSLLGTPGGVDNIVVDRHYSYKEVTRWADELRIRGISQHFDMRKREQGFTDVNGMRLVAGWMHCPKAPDELADIPRPGPGSTKAQRDKFARLIAQRQAFAMGRHEAARHKDGRTRWVCPAVAGTVGCSLRGPEQVAEAKAHGLPMVQDPPDPATAPACCTNSSGITSDTTPQMRKHQQPHYWGSPDWHQAYTRRTYVEGFFGSLKNVDAQRLTRGFTKFVGLPMVSLGVGLAAAVCNVRHQRKFWENDPERPGHPLLEPDPDFLGWSELTQDQAHEIDQRHRRDAA